MLGGGGYAWGGYYETGSLIWRSRWTTRSVTECREALAMPADPHCGVLLRRVVARRGPARLRVVLDLRAGFGSGPAGLYAEAYDVRQRQLRGNLPRAFVHAGMLATPARLSARGAGSLSS